MNILIANDDGVEARGLHELARALHEEAGADIYVCAPDGQRSASGHGITVNDPIAIRQAQMDNVETAYVISGLPADCVKAGLEFLRRAGIHIDMVFSGINHGGNLGTDTLYSGTVSAALEGCLCGIPSVAVSVDSHHAEHFDYACELAVSAAKSLWRRIEAGTADHRTVLNINVPNKPREEIKGLRFTRLGDRKYLELFFSKDGDGEAKIPGEFRYTGEPVQYEGLPPDVDVAASQEGCASITPIHTDLTSYGMIDEIKSWNLG